MANLNNFSGLWAIGVVASCLEPGPGVIQNRRTRGLVCESQIKEVVGCVGFWIGQLA